MASFLSKICLTIAVSSSLLLAACGSSQPETGPATVTLLTHDSFVVSQVLIDQLKAEKPDLEARQRAGRALLWDKKLDRDLQGEYAQGRVAQKPYVYLTDET